MTMRSFHHTPRLVLLFTICLALAMGGVLSLLHPLSARAAGGTTYYVDSASGNDGNNGTDPSTPWQSLGKVNSWTFQAGDHILLKAGNTWTGQLAPQGSGASGSPIVIDQYGSGNKPRIDGQGNATYGTVYLHDQQYWEINNLELTDQGSTNAYKRAGVYVSAAANTTVNHIHIQNLLVHDVNGYKDSNSNGPAAETGGIIVVGDDAASGAINGTFNDILIANNTVLDVGTSGIWVGAALGGTNVPLATNVVIQNNLAYNIGANGIWTYGTHGALVDHNTVHETNVYNVGGVVSMWDFGSNGDIFQHNEVYHTGQSNDGEAFDCDGGVQNSIFQYNYSHDNLNGFMTWYDTNGANSGCIVRYNISQNDGSAGGRSIFENTSNAHAAQVYNNTIYMASGNSTHIVGNAYANVASNALWNNNIIYNLGNGSFASNDAYGVGAWSHNLFYGNHPSDEPNDASKLTSDPLFSNPGGAETGRDTASAYQLRSGSPAIGSGTPISNNGGQDFFGNAISNPPNRGAYEGAGVGGDGGGSVTINDTDSGISYNGSGWYHWNAGPGSGYYQDDFHATRNNGDSTSYTFTGTGISYNSSTCTDRGNVDVAIDGVYQTTVNAYSSTCANSHALYSLWGLTSGQHTITLTKKDGQYMLLDSLTVQTSGTTINDTDNGITYNGGWYSWNAGSGNGYYNDDFHATRNDGDSASYTFTGTGISYMSSICGDRGNVDVYIDGNYQTTVNAYASTCAQQQVLYSTTGLTSGQHTLKLVKHGGQYMVLDALTYQ